MGKKISGGKAKNQKSDSKKSNTKTKDKAVLNKNISKNSNFLSKIFTKPYILIIVVSLVVYSQHLFYGFVNFDDNKIKNEVVGTIGGIDKIGRVFTQSYGNFYRPLQTGIFVIEKEIGGDNAFIYHLNNLFFHIIACLLIYVLFKRLKYKELTAGLASMIYCVHPMFTHSVVWIPSRGDVLLTIFTALTLIWFFDFKEKLDWKNIILCWIAYFLALLSKETAIVIPGIVLVYWLVIEKKNIFTSKNMIVAAGWVVLSGVWFLMRNASLANVMIMSKTLGLDFFIINLQMIPEMLSKFVFPFNIAVMPVFTTEKLIIGMLAILAGIVAYIISKSKRGNYSLFGLSWFLIFLLPVLFFRLPNADQYYDYLDHRIYLPMIGVIIILFEIIPKRWIDLSNTTNSVVIIGILAIWGLLAFFQTHIYKDPISFWSDGIKDNPDRAMYHYGMGLAYKLRLSEIDDSMNKFSNEISAERQKTIPQDMQNYSDLAEKHFRATLLLDSTTRDVALELGELYYKKQDYNNAIRYFEKAKRDDPSSNVVDVNLAVSYASVGQVGRAIEMLKRAIAADPNEKDAYFNLYVSYKIINDFENAYKTAKKLEELGEKIDWSDYYASLSNFNLQHKNIAAAQENSQKALSLNQNSALANMVLGVCFLETGRANEGIPLIEKSVTLYPQNIEGLQYLYNYYKNTKNMAETEKYAQRIAALRARPN